MGRLVTDTAVLFKNEATYGVDAVPAPATDAMLLRKFTCKQEIKYVNSPEVRPYMGKPADVVAQVFVSGTFEVALSGSGVAGTVTMWGRLLRASGFAEVITAAARVDYTPITNLIESGTLYYYDSGVLKKALGLRCNITGIKLGYGDVPFASFSYQALDGGDTAVASPALTLTAWKPPVAVNQSNSGMLTLGCTYAAGALSGGTTYPSKGLDLAMGGQIAFNPMIGAELVDYTERDMSGKITLDLTPAQEIANLGIVKSGAVQSMGFVHGTVAGHKLLTYMPAVQLKNPVKDVLNGRRVITYDINPVATAAGNDEVRFVTL